jgi:hypothetical protein
MTDHVHLEILDRRGERIDGARVIFARAADGAPARG